MDIKAIVESEALARILAERSKPQECTNCKKYTVRSNVCVSCGFSSESSK